VHDPARLRPYNRVVGLQPLSRDTPFEIERRQIEGWRRMTPAAKLRLVLGMSASVRRLALAGVRRRYPDAGPREQELRLAKVLFGDELARRAYPELDALDRQ